MRTQKQRAVKQAIRCYIALGNDHLTKSNAGEILDGNAHFCYRTFDHQQAPIPTSEAIVHRAGHPWLKPVGWPPLSAHEVHVWRTTLDRAPSKAEELLLSPDEQSRAGSFRFERDRCRFVSGRVFLRTVLAHYVMTEPSMLRLKYGPWGKPAVAWPTSVANPRFNLTHSDGFALLAVTCNHEVGIDLERLRSIPEAEAIVAQLFADKEVYDYYALPVADRHTGFLRCWTRKEAFIKATGRGLSLPLRAFCVPLTGIATAIHLLCEMPDVSRAWTLHTMEPTVDHVAAVAVADDGRDMIYRHLVFPPTAY